MNVLHTSFRSRGKKKHNDRSIMTNRRNYTLWYTDEQIDWVFSEH